jgi:hypothetical protein
VGKRWIHLLLTVQLAVSPAAAERQKPVGKGFWKILVKRGAKWILHPASQAKQGGAPVRIAMVIETYDVRRAGNADVARLRWTLLLDSYKDEIVDTYAQVAVTDAGLYSLPGDMGDTEIAKALKGKPLFEDPPRAYHKLSGDYLEFLEIHDGVLVCMGRRYVPPPGPPCMDYCDDREICISATAGIVHLSGYPEMLPLDLVQDGDKTLPGDSTRPSQSLFPKELLQLRKE